MRDMLRVPECSQATSIPLGSTTREYRRDFFVVVFVVIFVVVIGLIAYKRNPSGAAEKPLRGKGLSY
jgi:hypothetical protein